MIRQLSRLNPQLTVWNKCVPVRVLHCKPNCDRAIDAPRPLWANLRSEPFVDPSLVHHHVKRRVSSAKVNTCNVPCAVVLKYAANTRRRLDYINAVPFTCDLTVSDRHCISCLARLHARLHARRAVFHPNSHTSHWVRVRVHAVAKK